jgi:hypothetical protein
MGGVANDDDWAAMPDRNVTQVERVVGGQLQLAGPDQVDGRSGIPLEQRRQLLLPGGVRRRGSLVGTDRVARPVDEPEDVAGGSDAISEERSAPEDHVPRLAFDIELTGATNWQIADALSLRPKNVMHHSVSIYSKLGARGRRRQQPGRIGAAYRAPTGRATARRLKSGRVGQRGAQHDNPGR